MRERCVRKTAWLRRMFSLALALMLVVGAFGGSAFCVRAAEAAEGKIVYLDGVSGDDGREGQSKDTAVATFARAKELAGDAGKIYVCGTVAVNDAQTWSLDQGVSLERDYGFTGAIANVSGSLALSGIVLYQSDVTGAGAVEGITGRAAAADICVPSSVTLVEPKALSGVSLTELCVGNGAFAWADGSFVPDRYETNAQIIFTPSDMDTYDYSSLPGWDEASCTIVRSVTVITQSLLETEAGEDENSEENGDEAKAPEAGEDASGGKVPAEDEKADEAAAADETVTADTDKEEAGEPEAADKAEENPAETDKAPAETDNAPAEEAPDKTEAADQTDSAAEEPAEGKADEAANPEQSDEEAADAGEENTDNEAEAEAPQEPKEEASALEEALACLEKLPEEVKTREDVDAVVKASVAYEKLSDEEKAQVDGALTAALYEGQTASLAVNRSSLGVTVIGDLPWYIQFRAEVITGNTVDDSSIRALLESYEFKLWNLITDEEYKLDGQSVTILMAAPAETEGEIVIYHYLPDGSVEQIVPEISGDQMRFVTSSFSPFSVVSLNVAGSTELIGNTGFSYMGGGSSGSKKDNTTGGTASQGTSSGGSKDSSGGSGSSGNSGSSGSNSGSSGKKNTSSGSSKSGITKVSVGSSKTGAISKLSSVVTGDKANLVGYSMVSVGTALLLLFAGYVVYVQKKRKAWVRK